jgi:hypothetical protein
MNFPRQFHDISQRPRYYVPDRRGGFRPAALLEWAAWFEGSFDEVPFHEGGRRVARADLGPDVLVSTVFLGMDHSFLLDEGPPILFETMILGGPHESYQERYATLAEAEEGHARALAIAKGEQQP